MYFRTDELSSSWADLFPIQIYVVEDAPDGRLGQGNRIASQMFLQLVQLAEYRFFFERSGLDLFEGVDLGLQLFPILSPLGQ